MPLRSRDIRTSYNEITCDICGRTLLRGERAEPFLTGGPRRLVCELCTVRATHEGWIRESGADELSSVPRSAGRGSRSLLGRLRTRRPEPAPIEDELELDPALAAELEHHPVVTERRSEPEPVPEFAREPRHVHAVPTNAELKMERAVEVFNTSQHPRTVAGVARSLGAPEVSVRTSEVEPSVVSLFVMWELSWYRFEVDLSDEAGGARRVAQGAELDEIDDDDRVPNAMADERGRLALAT
ncbi:MAG: hypothetical protein QOG77_251 [Solirubrobacteraceae bacterium]|nr:hypothetical protein [Solirubrobacteraceae bacterium]